MDLNATLLGQMLSFALFVGFTMKWVWPPLERVLAERRDKIAAGLAEAEQGRHFLEQAQKNSDLLLKEAHDKAQDILREAYLRAEFLMAEAKKEAEMRLKAESEKAALEIHRMSLEARKELESELGTLAILAAGNILEEELDIKKQSLLLEKWTEKWLEQA